jgi:hypothetical protein
VRQRSMEITNSRALPTLAEKSCTSKRIGPAAAAVNEATAAFAVLVCSKSRL